MFCVAVTSLCPAQTFENTNPDTKESPYIERLVVSTAEQSLVLRFEGKLGLGKGMKEDWLNVQLFRLNPDHQIPVPEFDSIEVKMK